MSFPIAPVRGTALQMLALSVLGAPSLAQDAFYNSSGTPCVNQKNVNVTLDGTLPILGRRMTITTTSVRGAPGWLVFSPRWKGSRGADLTGMGMTGCRLYVGLDNSVTVPLRSSTYTGRAYTSFTVPNTVPRGTLFFNQSFMVVPGANPLGVVSSNARLARIGDEPDLTVDEITNFAPVVRIHPSEKNYPMDPAKYIEISRFRHHRTLWPDRSYNKVTRRWVTTDSKSLVYYNPSMSVLKAHTLHSNGKNRRPRDSNSNSSFDVYLHADGRPVGERSPNRRAPTYYYYRRNGAVHEIQYWWFCGFNDFWGSFNHQGDFEHVTVHVKDRRIIGAYYAAHHDGNYYPRKSLTFVGTHPVVYMAQGSHAAYNKPGKFFNYLDETKDGGYQWSTHLKLERLAAQPWRDYAGGWGSVGLIEVTTGPLGPWFKRFNK